MSSRNLLIAVPQYFQQDREATTFEEFSQIITPKLINPEWNGEDPYPIGLWGLTSLHEIGKSDASALLRDGQVRSCLRAHEERLRNGRIKRHAAYVHREGEIYHVDNRRHVTRVGNGIWGKNVITDVGGKAMLQNLWNATGSAVTIMKYIAISTDEASTTLTASTTTSAITSISVAALPKALSSGATVVIGYGTGTTQTLTLNGSASLGATSITVNSFTPSIDYPIGTWVVPNPAVTDNPSSISGAVYSSALSSGNFDSGGSPSGSGAGNRQRVIAYTFDTSTTAGNYRGTWTANTSPVGGTGQTASHLIHPAMVVNNQTNLLVTETLKV